jgi:hypothetical protein
VLVSGNVDEIETPALRDEESKAHAATVCARPGGYLSS